MRLRVALARRAAPVVVLLVLALVGSVACTSSRGQVTATDAPGRPLTVVGDSLSVLGRQPIRAVLTDAGWDVLIDAFPGRTVAEQIPAMRYAAATDPRRAVIIELGTNDAVAVAEGRLDRNELMLSITEALDLFPDRCVVWVLPAADPQEHGAMVGAAIGAELMAQAERRPNLLLADFAAVLAEHPEYLIDDRVHLTDDGSQALAELMATTVAGCASI